MNSMTGYGEARARRGGRQLALEITSVNSRRGIECQVNVPRD
jgi:uncharacterized protein YicC (UPF0701 family)